MTKTEFEDIAPEGDPKGVDQERIAKVLARAGLCSRREAEEWVAAGRVAVDGTVLTTPAFTVGPQSRITVDGRPLPVKERTRLWLFHKPRGLVTTTSDPEGRPTVFSVLPDDMPRVITVGRLDINTEGLLLLTNDGGLARVLELPSTGWLRRYRVRAYGEVDQGALDALKEGVSLDGVDYGPIEASIDRVQGSNIWLVVGLREGKNREVKRVLGALGLSVNRLIRISFGPFQLADLEEGEIREIRGRVLRDQLGKRLVAESGADFEAPIVHHVHGGDKAEEAPKRRIKDFVAAAEADDRPSRGGDRDGARRPRTKMEFIGTGERRRGDREERGGKGGDERGGGRPFRSEGPRERPEGGFRDRPEGFRDRPQGGYRDKPQGGFRDRAEGGFRDRPRGEDRGPRPEGSRDRPGYGGGPRGDRPDRGRDDRPPREGGRFGGPRFEGERDRGPRSGGPRDRGEAPRSEGFRGRSDGAPRGSGFRDRPEGGSEAPAKPRSGGFKARPDGAGFGPRGPRGLAPGGKKGGPARRAGRPGGAGGGVDGPRGGKPGGGKSFGGGKPGFGGGRGGKPGGGRGFDGPKGGKPGGKGGRGPRPSRP